MSAPGVRLSDKKSEIEGADDLRLQGQTRRRSEEGRARRGDTERPLRRPA